MPDRRTDWTAFAAALVSLVSVGIILWIVISFFGCAAVRGPAAGVNAGQQVTADRVELMESAIVDLDRKLDIEASNRQSGQAGRDVTINDPWPLRLLLGGIPASFIAYLLSKRVPAIRKIYDALSGKPCPERQAGRCIPTPMLWPNGGDGLEAVVNREALGPQDETG